jgi:putative transposase
MKQRHSFTNLLYHLVFRTKNREHFILGEPEENNLLVSMRAKAHELDAWIEEFGGWREHVHLLVRARPTIALSDVYGQLKGFASWEWRRQWPDRPFGWGDGVYVVTVDPDNCDGLRAYIRNQRTHHGDGTIVTSWEPPDDSPPGLALRSAAREGEPS